jgi:hypothetical protein
MKTLVLATAVAAALVSTPALAQNPGSTTTSTQSTTTQTTQTTTSTWVPSTGTTNRPTYEFSLGYQWLRTGEFCAAFDASDCSDDDPETFPAGVIIDAVRNFGAFGIVGEAGWSRAEETGGSPFADRLETDLFHAAAGVRFTGRFNRIWPYAQGIGGIVYNRFDGVVGGLDFVDTRTRGMAQAGGGVTFVVGDGWGLFIDGMYRRMFLDDEEDFTSGRNDIRVAGGFRLILD